MSKRYGRTNRKRRNTMKRRNNMKRRNTMKRKRNTKLRFTKRMGGSDPSEALYEGKIVNYNNMEYIISGCVSGAAECNGDNVKIVTMQAAVQEAEAAAQAKAAKEALKQGEITVNTDSLNAYSKSELIAIAKKYSLPY